MWMTAPVMKKSDARMRVGVSLFQIALFQIALFQIALFQAVLFQIALFLDATTTVGDVVAVHSLTSTDS
jgi:hypothetical protein